MQALKTLSKEWEFVTVDANIYRNKLASNAFISGLASTYIRQCILENDTLSLGKVEEISHSLESVRKHSEAYYDKQKSISDHSNHFY